METEEANALLPAQPTKAPTDARRLKYLVIAPPKWGKTSFLCSVPDSLLLATEEGHAFHETHKIIIDAWDKARADRGLGVDDDGNHHLSMVEAVEAIIASDRFQFIVIDTADMAAKLCLDWHYKQMGVKHASDAGDYGKGWDLCLTQPFRQQIGQLMKSGRGIGFITHTNVIEKKVGNTTTSRAETTLPSQVQKFLHTQADVILHGSFGRKVPGSLDRDRIISMDGTNEILAGSRVRGVTLPRKFIVSPDHPWEQWAGFFTDPDTVEQANKEYAERGRQVATEVAAEPEHKTISEPVIAAEETVEQPAGRKRKR
jgi:hypothetical protein